MVEPSGTCPAAGPQWLVVALLLAVVAVVLVSRPWAADGGDPAGRGDRHPGDRHTGGRTTEPRRRLHPVLEPRSGARVRSRPTTRSVDEVSPWTYTIGPDGSVVSAVPPQDTATAAATMARLRGLGVPVMPSVSNMVDGDFSYDAVAPVLHDPATTARNIDSMTRLAVTGNYAGIDLDYEELRGGRPGSVLRVRHPARGLAARRGQAALGRACSRRPTTPARTSATSPRTTRRSAPPRTRCG